MELSKEQPQWRSSRIEGNPQAEQIAERLGEVAEQLDLEVYYSQEDVDKIIESATHLATHHELKEKFFKDPRKCVFLMGIAEEWEATDDLEEKKRLLDTLSIAAADSKRGETFSGRTIRLSARGSKRGVEFDPTTDNTLKESMKRLNKDLEDDKDESGTGDLKAQMRDWSRNSIFAHVRDRLHVTKEGERPVEIFRLKLGADEMDAKYGFVGLHLVTFDKQGRPAKHKILLNAEAQREEIEHEYAHSQACSGIESGFAHALDCGLNEALTENAINNPQAYSPQRKVLTQIKKDLPGFEEVAYLAYVTGEPEDLLRLDRVLIYRYGLRGRLAIARMTANKSKYFAGQTEQCTITPPEADRLLNQLRKETGDN